MLDARLGPLPEGGKKWGVRVTPRAPIPPTSTELTRRVEEALANVRTRTQSRTILHRAMSGDHAAAAAIGTAKFRYLDALDRTFDNVAITDIAMAIGVDVPRASRLTRQLEDDGLIERAPTPGRGRAVVVRLTSKGEATIDAIHATRHAAVASALATLSPEEGRTFASLLERFVAAWPRENYDDPHYP